MYRSRSTNSLHSLGETGLHAAALIEKQANMPPNPQQKSFKV
jgi:hypothetical protein